MPPHSASLYTYIAMDDGKKCGVPNLCLPHIFSFQIYAKAPILYRLPYLKIKKIDSRRRQTCKPLIICGQNLAMFGHSACPFTVRRFLHSLPWMMARNVVFYTNKVWRIAVKHTGGLSLGLLLPSCRPLFRASLLPPYKAVGTGRAKGSNANPDFGNIRDHLYKLHKGKGGYY